MKNTFFSIVRYRCFFTGRLTLLPAIIALAVLICSVEESVGRQAPGRDSGPGSESVQADSCLVEIIFFVHIQPRMASNQYAVWIEDMDGNYIATVFATRYTAHGGYEHRPLSLPAWREASGWDHQDRSRVDAVSGATPVSGEHVYSWDCRDEQGRVVAPGTYLYRVEGNIFWENRVVWTGEIDIGPDEQKSQAEPEYLPPRAFRRGILLDGVKAAFRPGSNEPDQSSR